jgi:hypothetical protein
MIEGAIAEVSEIGYRLYGTTRQFQTDISNFLAEMTTLNGEQLTRTIII